MVVKWIVAEISVRIVLASVIPINVPNMNLISALLTSKPLLYAMGVLTKSVVNVIKNATTMTRDWPNQHTKRT